MSIDSTACSRLQNFTRRPPPAPKGHWFWGHWGLTIDPLAYMRNMVENHGGVVKLRLLWHEAWLVTDPDIVEAVLISQAQHFRKSWVQRQLPIALGKGLLASEGEFYVRQRRLAQPFFQRSHVEQYFNTMVEATLRMLSDWQAGQVHDILYDLHGLTQDIASRTLFGASGENNASRVREALRTGQAEFVRRLVSLIQLPLWIPTPGNLRLRKAVKELDDIIYGFIHERRLSGEHRNDLLSQLLTARDQVDASGMSDQQLRDECLTIFLAGQETTALTLAWAWYLLSQNPAAAQSMYENVDSLLSGRLPTMDDIAQLSEVEYVVLEALRLYPAIHAIGREALVDTELGDFYCPRGTTLFMSPWAAQRNSHYFPNPDTFQPSRWRNGLEKRLPRGAFFPFSAGPRTCLGVHFAMVQMKLVLTLMAQRFQFTMTPGSTVIPVAQVTLQPSPGVPSLLTTR